MLLKGLQNRLGVTSGGENHQTRQLALDFGWIPVVPPKRTRLEPCEYDRVLYRRRNEVERLFRRLKGSRRIFSRFDKLDVMFLALLPDERKVRGLLGDPIHRRLISHIYVVQPSG